MRSIFFSCLMILVFLAGCASTPDQGLITKRIYLSAQSPDEGKDLNSFLTAYHKQVFHLLMQVRHLPIMPDDNLHYLILESGEGKYVQCALHDNDSKAYCEIASGLYRDPSHVALSKKTQEMVTREGFQLKEGTKNYSYDMDLQEKPQSIWALADFMLEMLYRVYNAKQGYVTARFPAVVRIEQN